jgi:hypothetical protein
MKRQSEFGTWNPSVVGEEMVHALFRGFSVTFKNGYRVSVQFGRGNYCQHHFDTNGLVDSQKEWVSKNAEVAVMASDGKFVDPARWYKKSGDTIVGYLTVEEVLKILQKVSRWRK